MAIAEKNRENKATSTVSAEVQSRRKNWIVMPGYELVEVIAF